MEREKEITLSFIDKSIAVTTVGNKTYATIKSGFKFTKFESLFRESGFKTIPEFVVGILEMYGYRPDYKNGMWVTKTTATAACAPDDKNVETTGNRIALMRAKQKAYDKANKCIFDIWMRFNDASRMLLETNLKLEKYIIAEGEAIDRVIETGKSDFIKE